MKKKRDEERRFVSMLIEKGYEVDVLNVPEADLTLRGDDSQSILLVQGKTIFVDRTFHIESVTTAATGTITAEAAARIVQRGRKNPAPRSLPHPTPLKHEPETIYPVPRLGEFILLCVLPKKARESLPGDLAEEFAEIERTFGLRSARIWYWIQVLKAIGPLVGLGFAWLTRQLGR